MTTSNQAPSPLIATTAPSGNVGQHVVRDLVRAGVRPRVLAHGPDSLASGLRDHVDLVVVDLADEEGMASALDGADSLFLTVPAPMSDDPLADYHRFATSVASAVEGAGVSRVVLQSSGGAELRHGAGEIDGLGHTEEVLEATAASVLHLRCGFFYSNLLLQLGAVKSGEVPVVVPTDQRMPWVAPNDIAAIASSWLLRPEWSGRHLQGVHGPEDLSWDEALAVVSEATGHGVRAVRVSDDDMRGVLSGAGMSPKQVEAVLGMSTGLRDGYVPELARDATTTTPTTLGAWAYDVLRPALEA